MTKNISSLSEISLYDGSFDAPVISGYRVASLLVTDSGACQMEGLNFNMSSNRGYAFGPSSNVASAPASLVFAIQITYMKDL